MTKAPMAPPPIIMPSKGRACSTMSILPPESMKPPKTRPNTMASPSIIVIGYGLCFVVTTPEGRQSMLIHK